MNKPIEFETVIPDNQYGEIEIAKADFGVTKKNYHRKALILLAFSTINFYMLVGVLKINLAN